MSVWNKRHDRKLERRLRAGRAVARKELVERLALEIPSPHRAPSPRRGTPAGVVVILALTIAIAAALDLAGATGYGRASIDRFSSNVEHIFSPPGPEQDANSAAGPNTGGKGENANVSGDEGDPFKDPFNIVHGTELPICDPNDNLQSVSDFDWFRYIAMPGFSVASYDPSAQGFYCAPHRR